MSRRELYKVLIVDDDENVRRILDRILQNSGTQIYQCSSVSEGIMMAESLIPHLIFLDINFPVDNGFKFLEARNTNVMLENCHVVMMSTEAISENVRKAINLGANDFISKPLVNYIVMQKMRKALLNKPLSSVEIPAERSLELTSIIKYKSIIEKERMISLLSPVRFGENEKISIYNNFNGISPGVDSWKVYRKIAERCTIYNGVYRSIVSLTGDNPSAQIDNSSSVDSYDEEDILLKHRPKIFVLDDDENFTKLIRFFYDRYGAKVEVFSSIEEFKAALSRETPAVCILDLSINETNDVFTLIEFIKIHYSFVTMIVATGNTDEIAVRHALDLGADDYVYKPIKKDLLLHKVVRVISKDDLTAFDKLDLSYNKEIKLKEGFLSFPLTLKKVDELGMFLLSNSYVGKGTKIRLESLELGTVLQQKFFDLHIKGVGHLAGIKKYSLYGEFIDLDNEQVGKILNYCHQR